MIRWMTISEAARFFGKDQSVIRRWCYTGAVIEFGFRVQRDLTGHWKIGIPNTLEPCIPVESSTRV